MYTTELMNKIRRIEIRTRRLVNDSFAGEYHSVFKGQGMEFDEVRPYLPGDEVLTSDHEYGACDKIWTFVCRKTGATYRRQPIPLPIASADETCANLTSPARS